MTDWRYGVILDAGSSGTRIHIYRWQFPPSIHTSSRLPVLQTEKAWTKKVQPGISSFGDHADRVGPDHLHDLVEHATKHIPAAQLAETPIFLLATAGMRLLPASQRAAIITQTCSYLVSTTSFSLPDCEQHVQVIDGEAEGLYGWIAANYLLGGFDPVSSSSSASSSASGPASSSESQHTTFGFLEMGGASAQIAFAPNGTESAKHANDLKLVRMRALDGRTREFRVFVTTWLGYGVQEARRRYLDSLLNPAAAAGAKIGLGKTQRTGGMVVDPCLPNGVQTTVTGDVVLPGGHNDDNNKNNARVVGKGSFTDCLKQTFPLLDKDAPCDDEPCLVHGIHTPAIDFNVNHFVGTSEFWYSTHGVLGPSESDNDDSATSSDKAYDFHTYQKKVEAFCTLDWRTIKKGLKRGKYGKHVSERDVIGVCFKASWIINMLHDGIGVPRVGLDPVPDADASGNGTEAVQDAAEKKGFLSPFRAVDKVGDVEVSWTLGRMLLYASSQIEPAASSKNTLAVGYGSNIAGAKLPADFQFGGPIGTRKMVKGGILSSASTGRRVPGLILFLLIFAVAAFLLCGRERRRIVYGRLASLVGRGTKLGGGASISVRTSGFGYEPVVPAGADDEYYDQLEMGKLETGQGASLDSDSDPVSVTSPRRKRAGLGMFSDVAGPERQGPAAALGLVGGVDSRERLSQGQPTSIRSLNASGSRSRTGSPIRRGSPMVPPFKSSVD